MNDELKQRLAGESAYVAKLHVEPLQMARGSVDLRMPLASNTNHIQTMHAGALFTLGELPGGALFLTSFDVERFYPIVKSMTIRFRRPATTDITVHAELDAERIAAIQTEADRHGKAEFTLTCDLRDAQGEVVAQTEALYQLRRKGT